MINKAAIWPKIPKNVATDQLWFLFEQPEFYQFEYLRNFIKAIRTIRETLQQPFILDESNNIIREISDIPIEYDFQRSENGEEKIKPYILQGENLYSVHIFKDETIVINDIMLTENKIDSQYTLDLVETWFELLKTETKTQLKIQFEANQKRIAELQAVGNKNSFEKFELQVLEYLQKCDTTQEFDLLYQKTSEKASESSLTERLLALIQAKRELYQL